MSTKPTNITTTIKPSEETITIIKPRLTNKVKEALKDPNNYKIAITILSDPELYEMVIEQAEEDLPCFEERINTFSNFIKEHEDTPLKYLGKIESPLNGIETVLDFYQSTFLGMYEAKRVLYSNLLYIIECVLREKYHISSLDNNLERHWAYEMFSNYFPYSSDDFQFEWKLYGISRNISIPTVSIPKDMPWELRIDNDGCNIITYHKSNSQFIINGNVNYKEFTVPWTTGIEISINFPEIFDKFCCLNINKFDIDFEENRYDLDDDEDEDDDYYED